jgi:hypothetical protein
MHNKITNSCLLPLSHLDPSHQYVRWTPPLPPQGWSADDKEYYLKMRTELVMKYTDGRGGVDVPHVLRDWGDEREAGAPVSNVLLPPPSPLSLLSSHHPLSSSSHPPLSISGGQGRAEGSSNGGQVGRFYVGHKSGIWIELYFCDSFLQQPPGCMYVLALYLSTVS